LAKRSEAAAAVCRFFAKYFQDWFDFRLNNIAYRIAIVAGIIVTAWLQLRRKHLKGGRESEYWSSVAIRYLLAYIFLTYGFWKVFHRQFTSDLNELDTLLGDVGRGSTLPWRFFGYSRLYVWFVALSELVPGFLMFFRRTTLFAAVTLIPVLVN